MSSSAPYTDAMRLGQGFNSYTQEICIENAVLIEPARKASISLDGSSSISFAHPDLLQPPTTPKILLDPSTKRESSGSESITSNSTLPSGDIRPDPKSEPSKPAPTATVVATLDPQPSTSAAPEDLKPPHKDVVQTVVYSSRLVDNMSDIVEALNISSSASIKYGTIKGSGSASIVNENKVNQSDLNYIVTVTVTNEKPLVGDVMAFNAIPELDHFRFTEIFGDCFISDFTEGGTFSAIVSIKVNDKSKISAVKAAAEAEIAIAAAPGLSVGASNNLDKHKSDVWDDTETTISVSWAGGGNLKTADDKWDLQTVVAVAAKFPDLVQTCPQRTSAILTRYTSLRSFNEVDAKNPAESKFKILDYDLCSLYTQDLFSAFMAYKSIWADLSDMMKNPEQYREREVSTDVPNPVQLTPQGLNEARLLSSKGLIQITAVTKALNIDPSLAGLDGKGQQRPLPYLIPGGLKERMPIRHHGLTIREQADLVRRDTNISLLTSQEVKKIGKWARDDDLHFSNLAGDHLDSQRSWLNQVESGLFCTLDTAESSSHLESLTRLRFEAHQNRGFDWLSLFGRRSRSKRCHGCLSAIGYSTTHNANAGLRDDGVDYVVGKANKNHEFWSQPLAELTMSKVVKVRIEYASGSNSIAALIVLDAQGREITSWKKYGQAKLAMPSDLKSVEQEPPDERSGWVLAGFWGHTDSIVITSVGAIWKKG